MKAPRSAYTFAKRLRALRRKRRELTKENRPPSRRRKALTQRQRQRILAKTARRCHVCGGVIRKSERWHADHVQPHASGGEDSEDNFLPSCSICNNYRWHMLPEEIRTVIKLGVFARNEIEKDSGLGSAVAEKFVQKEKQRATRSVKKKSK